MSYAAREARRFFLALMVAGLGILVTACDSVTAPEDDLAAQLRHPDVSVDDADRGTDEAGRQAGDAATSAGKDAGRFERPKYRAE